MFPVAVHQVLNRMDGKLLRLGNRMGGRVLWLLIPSLAILIAGMLWAGAIGNHCAIYKDCPTYTRPVWQASAAIAMVLSLEVFSLSTAMWISSHGRRKTQPSAPNSNRLVRWIFLVNLLAIPLLALFLFSPAASTESLSATLSILGGPFLVVLLAVVVATSVPALIATRTQPPAIAEQRSPLGTTTWLGALFSVLFLAFFAVLARTVTPEGPGTTTRLAIVGGTTAALLASSMMVSVVVFWWSGGGRPSHPGSGTATWKAAAANAPHYYALILFLTLLLSAISFIQGGAVGFNEGAYYEYILVLTGLLTPVMVIPVGGFLISFVPRIIKGEATT